MDRTQLCGSCDAGSIPAGVTLNELNDFKEDKEWALRSNAHAVSPVFANEFWVRNSAPPSAVRTVFSPRSRFVSNAILEFVLSENTKRILR